MPTVRITWVDSTTPGVIGTKIYRQNLKIGDVGNGVQTFDDDTALVGETYKYEVQAYTATDESTAEVIGVNTENITISAETAPTNYVFDGSSTSYMKDKAVPAVMLNGIVNQTFIVRLYHETFNLTQQHGILGTENATIAVKLEVDIGDDRADVVLQDNGTSAFTNAAVTKTAGWYIYSITYNGNNLKMWEDKAILKDVIEPGFIGRTDGRILIAGAAVLAGVAGYLKGEISDIQFYNRALTETEVFALVDDLTDLPTDNATSLVANFAGQKTENGAFAGDWTSEVNGYVLENKGGVTFN